MLLAAPQFLLISPPKIYKGPFPVGRKGVDHPKMDNVAQV